MVLEARSYQAHLFCRVHQVDQPFPSSQQVLVGLVVLADLGFPSDHFLPFHQAGQQARLALVRLLHHRYQAYRLVLYHLCLLSVRAHLYHLVHLLSRVHQADREAQARLECLAYLLALVLFVPLLAFQLVQEDQGFRVGREVL